METLLSQADQQKKIWGFPCDVSTLCGSKLLPEKIEADAPNFKTGTGLGFEFLPQVNDGQSARR